MIEFFVSGQRLKYYTPVIAADSLNYLTAKVNFTGDEWDGYSKWLHFRQNEELGADTYDIQLDENNEITEDKRLNLTVGEWDVYLTGTRDNSRLTTVPVVMTVQESGLIDAPLHELPMSVAEQVDYTAKRALTLAQQVKDMADSGAFKAEALKPLAYFSTLEELQANVPEPEAGDSYGVGDAAPYDIYTWDGINMSWVNNGPVEGPEGVQGEQGTTFIPHVDDNGIITWSNDGGLDNPPAQNLTGPVGPQGEPGKNGKSPYEAAKENGYSGTEMTFNKALTALPYHNARHKPDGADPILMQTGNYSNASVTAEKLASGSVARVYTAKIDPTKWSGSAAPYTQTVLVDGFPESDRIIADLIMSEDWDTAEQEDEEFAKILRMVPGSGKLTVFATDKTGIALNIKLVVLHGSGLGTGGSGGTGGDSGGSGISSDGLTLIDRSTGTAYSLYVNDGKLTMA